MEHCHSLVKYYRNKHSENVQEFWISIFKKGLRMDLLRDLMIFYMHHKKHPPVTQKAFDILLQGVYCRETCKKMNVVIFQVLEEICSCLESSVVETITLSPMNNMPVDILNCVLVGGLVPLLGESTIDELFSVLRSDDMFPEERGKLLLFLCNVNQVYPSICSDDNLTRLGNLLMERFRDVQYKVVASSQLFGRTGSFVATEVDGTVAGEIFTVLTLANVYSDNHLTSIHLFSTLRDWLNRKMYNQCQQLSEQIREYCSLVVEQCLRPACKDHDAALQKAVICEVLDVLVQLVQLDQSQAPYCLLMVKRIQSNLTEKFKGDYHDVCIFVRVLSFLLNFGESTGYNSQLFCEQFLGNAVIRSYTSELAVFDIAIFLSENKEKMIALHQPLLQRFFPNLLKILACHPSLLIEEFIDLVPVFTSYKTAVELFHSIIDLPVLTATLFLHQASTLVQLESTGAIDACYTALLAGLRTPEFRPIFNYMMRMESGQSYMLDRMPAYMKFLKDLTCRGVVVTCSHSVPIILNAYFSVVRKWNDAEVLAPVLLAMLNRLVSLFQVSGYATAVQMSIFEHTKWLLKSCPDLLFTLQEDLVKYICTTKNYKMCSQVYCHIVWTMGEYMSPNYSTHYNNDQVSCSYEAIECVIYETLAQNISEESICLHLTNILCSALAKLASRCQDLICRAVLCLNKVKSHISSKLPNTTDENKQIVSDRLEELLCLLRNPNIAAVVWSSACTSKPTETAVVRLLTQCTDLNS